jgi:hypothetical protein
MDNSGSKVWRGLILSTAKTNRKISRKAPSRYLAEILPEDQRSAIRESHFAGPEAHEAMKPDDFEAFLEARERRILAKRRKQLEVAYGQGR